MVDKSFIHKLIAFNPSRPYVWELKITEEEFLCLEKDLCSYITNASNKDDALKMVVYVAEWYKRRYTNRAKKDYQKVFGGLKPDLETAWNTLGIDNKYLYRGENNQKLYLYSTFILGGLAVKFEHQKNEKPFLRALCRVYNKEDDSFDRIVDNNHSIAFKESIVQGHSLFDFLEAVITSHDNSEAIPYAEKDVANEKTEIGLLIRLIQDINYEVIKSKFRLEWIITAIPGDNLVSRRLRIWLNPEEKGQLHHLLRLDRLKKWGFTEPEEMRYIRIGVRYLKGKDLIKDADFNHPDIYYRNTGDSSVGFICEKADYACCNNVPVAEFDKIQLITWNDDGHELTNAILEEDVDWSVKQFYREEIGEDDWSTRVNNQKETALLYSCEWTIAENSIDKLSEKKNIYNKKFGEGYSFYWSYINTSITIEDGNESRTYYNRQGYDHIVARQYQETIQYTEDGKVMWHHSEDEDSPESTEPIYLIFGKTDLIAYHTENKEEGDEDTCEAIETELIEYKNSKGNYIAWTDTDLPTFGYNKLRVTVKQKQYLLNVFYLPKRIERNIEDNTIHYFNGEKDDVYADKVNIDGAKERNLILEPVVLLNIGSKISCIQVPVFRPVKLKEVCYNGRVLMYDNDGNVSIPYILKEFVDIHDYGDGGFRSYSCKDFRNIFADINRNKSEYLSSGKVTSAIDGKLFTDNDAPKGFSFFIRKTFSKDPQLRYCYWGRQKDTKPMPVKDIESFELQSGMVLFQDQRKISDRLQCEFTEKEALGFAKIHEGQMSAIEVFSIASEYNQYFFHFKEMRSLANGIEEKKRDFFKEIYNPILEKRNNSFSEKDHKDMLRFAEEFSLNELKEKIIVELNKTI